MIVSHVTGYMLIQVDRMAQLYDIHLRTGCFCNSGACQKYLDISNKQIIENMKASDIAVHFNCCLLCLNMSDGGWVLSVLLTSHVCY